jgi:hypothetical protein
LRRLGLCRAVRSLIPLPHFRQAFDPGRDLTPIHSISSANPKSCRATAATHPVQAGIGALSGAPYKSMFQNGIFFISYWYLFGLIYHCRQPDFFAQLKNKVSLIIAKRAICRHAKDLR